MDDLTYWPLLMRYLAGECSSEERAEVVKWIQAEPGRDAYVASLRQIANLGVRAGDRYAPRAAWEDVRRQLGIRGKAVPLVVQPERRPRSVRVISAFVAATALLVVLGIGFIGHSLNSGSPQSVTGRTYATAAGEHLRVILSDGSQVTLAPESHMQVATDYRHGHRMIHLEGEGYFTVMHDPAHPFVIQAHGVTTRDVGTAFDVRAYSEDDSVRIAVTDGQVAVATRSATAHEVALKRGDVATVSGGDVAIRHDGDVTALIGWIQGRLVFNGTPLPQVVRELARTFNLDITVRDSALEKQTVTGSFDNESANEVLYGITTVLGAQYDRDGRHVVIRKKTTAKMQDVPSAKLPLVRTAQASISSE